MKTHCKHGHARTPDNVSNSGHCKICMKERGRQHYIKNHAEYRSRAARKAAQNPGARREYSRAYYVTNRERLRQQMRDSKYGLAPGEYSAMLSAQGGVCGACHEPFTTERLFSPVVDHDHDTGEVRGILHSNCNVALGLMRDNATVAAGLTQYLLTHKGALDGEPRSQTR